MLKKFKKCSFRWEVYSFQFSVLKSDIPNELTMLFKNINTLEEPKSTAVDEES